MKNILLILIAVLLLLFALVPDASSADVARIHVIANSDSDEDIAIKLKVAEAVCELLEDKKFNDIDSVKSGLEKELDGIMQVCEAKLSELKAEYGCTAELGVRHFEEKSLGGSAFPDGDYLALLITLGEGEGHNWWSVIFPNIGLEASLAMGEEGNKGKTIVVGGDTIVKIRCLMLEFCKYILTKK